MNYQNKQTRDYLHQAYRLAASFSSDPHTKLGAVLVNSQGRVIGTGANSLPKDVRITADRFERPKKYSFIEHAERNAIYHACRNGESPVEGTLYCPWFACADCARAIIQAGITTVIGHKQMFDHVGEYHWSETIAFGNEMLEEAGVKTYLYDGVIDTEALFNGEIWKP
jgi:dCMP deaminase